MNVHEGFLLCDLEVWSFLLFFSVVSIIFLPSSIWEVSVISWRQFIYCQRFLLKPLLLLKPILFNSLIIILISSHFKNLLEELASHYIFDYSNFTENLSDHNSNIFFRSSFHHENIVSNRSFYQESIFVSNRSEGIIVVFHPSETFLSDYHIDSNSYDNRSFLTFTMPRSTFALCDIFSGITDVIVERWFDKFDYEMKDYQNDKGRFSFKKYLSYFNMLLIKDVIK